ncbi:hypothetical protein M2158_004084 [Streptomyces sp. SAI-144]|uniref:hypothetical protein n=1 Tax=Streptomyces sp. SAI-144 TaxID=2940544 RepID=UPI0024752F24|nr:hypothetical protein [Streptomyces sp. SAI-144]MDH6435607.1 hypothetical protein [Streptomyces sp. SAI-144]
MAIKRCSESFTIWRDGAPVAFVAGQLIDEKHPILKTHGHLFDDPATVPRPAPAELTATPVEEATANPGEQRNLTPPTAVGDGPKADGKPFDPSEHHAPEVLAYLDGVDEDERARILAAEAGGKKRKSILGDTPAAE